MKIRFRKEDSMKWFLRVPVTILTFLLVSACGGATPTATPLPTNTPVPTGKASAETVRVIVSEHSLQFMSFWIALGAGFFKEEGLDVRVVMPPQAGEAGQFLLQGRGEVAVLPPPIYLDLIGQEQPILVFATLLQKDPINLIVRKEVAEARTLSPATPLVERLKGVQGLKVGVAPGPPPRLRALFASVGMDADRDIQMITIPGEEQNQAFAENRVDALYAHTPYLEKALVEQGAVLLVNQSRGEVPELNLRGIHSLVTTRTFATAKPQVVLALTRGVYRAQKLVHADQKAAVDALFASGLPGLERKKVETIVAIYEPAIPQTPDVSSEGMKRMLELWPAQRTPPDLSKTNFADYVAPQFARQAVTASP